MAFAYTKILDYTEHSQTLPVRTEMESGTIHQVNRFTKHYGIASFKILLTKAQADQFVSWYKTNGHDWFTFPNIITGGTRDYRIVGGYSTSTFQTYQHMTVSFRAEFEV